MDKQRLADVITMATNSFLKVGGKIEIKATSNSQCQIHIHVFRSTSLKLT